MSKRSDWWKTSTLVIPPARLLAAALERVDARELRASDEDDAVLLEVVHDVLRHLLVEAAEGHAAHQHRHLAAEPAEEAGALGPA